MCNLDYLNDVAMKVYLVDNQKGGKYYILNCQIKLEKNYMLICNVLHEYF